MVALMVAACLGGGSGCSILFAKGPPERLEPHEPIRCSRSYALPVVDGIITALQVLRTLYAVSRDDRDYNGMPITRPADIGFGVGFSTLFLISTGVGISRVSDCNELFDKVERWPEPRRLRPPQNVWAPPPPAQPPASELDADTERAAAASAEEAKAAGQAAGAAAHQPAAKPPAK